MNDPNNTLVNVDGVEKVFHRGSEEIHVLSDLHLKVPKGEFLPHERMEHSEIRGRIDAAIAQLSPEHRAVILMKEMEDMQYHEIAEALGCSIGTVMSRLFYARKKLQNLLKDVYENV